MITERQAVAFINRVGFCLLFPQKDVPLPSLWHAAMGKDAPLEWTDDVATLWAWKDELPVKQKAWSGKLFKQRPSFLSRKTLPLFIAALRTTSWQELYHNGRLSQQARDIAAFIEEKGPTPAAVIRKRFTKPDRALVELQSALVLTHYGTEKGDSGWPSTVLEHVGRAFDGVVEEARELDAQHARVEVEERLAAHAPALPLRRLLRLS